MGCFLNMNELEFSETNASALADRGFYIKKSGSNAVFGSFEIALRIFEQAHENDLIHFCSSIYKDSVQLRMRLFRTADRTHRIFDTLTEDGTIVYARIYVKKEKVHQFTKYLKDSEIPKEAFEILFDFPSILPGIESTSYCAVDTSIGIGEELANIFEEEPGELNNYNELHICLQEQYPFENGLITEVMPIFDYNRP